jgi:hypothetical protein
MKRKTDSHHSEVDLFYYRAGYPVGSLDRIRQPRMDPGHGSAGPARHAGSARTFWTLWFRSGRKT